MRPVSGLREKKVRTGEIVEYELRRRIGRAAGRSGGAGRDGVGVGSLGGVEEARQVSDRRGFRVDLQRADAERAVDRSGQLGGPRRDLVTQPVQLARSDRRGRQQLEIVDGHHGNPREHAPAERDGHGGPQGELALLGHVQTEVDEDRGWLSTIEPEHEVVKVTGAELADRVRGGAVRDASSRLGMRIDEAGRQPDLHRKPLEQDFDTAV